jgi:hypothetical protein
MGIEQWLAEQDPTWTRYAAKFQDDVGINKVANFSGFEKEIYYRGYYLSGTPSLELGIGHECRVPPHAPTLQLAAGTDRRSLRPFTSTSSSSTRVHFQLRLLYRLLSAGC